MSRPSEASERPAVALIGYRGCGKSAVGRELAVLLQGDHADTDELVTTQAGCSIAVIFTQEGEEGFRRREREVITAIVSSPPTVVGVGGGAVTDHRTAKALKDVATIVWLQAPAEVLWERIKADPATADNRPSLTEQSGLDEVRCLLAERTPCYERLADLIVDTSQRSPREVALEITRRLRSELSA